MDGLDRRLGELGRERTALEAELSGGTMSGERIATIGRRLKALADEVETAELRWLELGEQVEAILGAA